MLGFVTPPDVSKSFKVPPNSRAEGELCLMTRTEPRLIVVRRPLSEDPQVVGAIAVTRSYFAQHVHPTRHAERMSWRPLVGQSALFRGDDEQRATAVRGETARVLPSGRCVATRAPVPHEDQRVMCGAPSGRVVVN